MLSRLDRGDQLMFTRNFRAASSPNTISGTVTYRGKPLQNQAYALQNLRYSNCRFNPLTFPQCAIPAAPQKSSESEDSFEMSAICSGRYESILQQMIVFTQQ